MLAVTTAEKTTLLPQLPLEPDLFGRMIFDHFQGRPGDYFLRRDDNFLERDTSARFFRSWEEMPSHQRCLLNHARGRVLDIGAGAGQHALVLQERGLAVTAIDTSPLAIEVCRARRLRDAQVMDAHDLAFHANSFDTVLMMNNNLGIGGTPEGLRGLLLYLHEVVKPGGMILTDKRECTTTNPTYARYQRWNAERGRHPGSQRLRVEYDGHCGEEFDWLMITLHDLRDLCKETGWRIARCVQVNADDATYAIGMERE